MAKKKKVSKNRKDLIILLFILSISAVINILFHFTYLLSALSFFLIPSLYLLMSKPKSIKRILTASLGSLPVLFTFDLFVTLNKGWFIPTNQLSIPYRILHIVPVDDLIWFSCWVLFITTFYEHFIDHDRSDKLSPNFPLALILMIFSFFTIIGLFFFAPNLLQQHYAYFTLLLLSLPILFSVVFHSPRLLVKFLLVIAFFAPVFFLFEIVGLTLGEWTFPGYYIGHVQFLSFTFPFEEFMLWIVLSSAVVLSYYELFIDDDR